MDRLSNVERSAWARGSRSRGSDDEGRGGGGVAEPEAAAMGRASGTMGGTL